MSIQTTKTEKRLFTKPGSKGVEMMLVNGRVFNNCGNVRVGNKYTWLRTLLTEDSLNSMIANGTLIEVQDDWKFYTAKQH